MPAPTIPPEHLWLAVHFSPSPSSRAAGLAFLKRKYLRPNHDPEASEEAAATQREAVGKYSAPGEGVLAYLKEIRQPTLIVQGSNDLIVPTVNSYILQQNLPNAQLILYPDANHGSFYQYPELFVIPDYNARFAVAAAEPGSAFIPYAGRPLEDVLASKRTARSDATTASNGGACPCRSRRREHPDDYDPGFEDVFVKLVNRLDPPDAT